MVYSEKMGSSSSNTMCATSYYSFSPSSSPSSSPPQAQPQAQAINIITSPCAACKILRRRCVDKCVLAPYFPPTQPFKFTIAHKVFGASNIIKLLQDLPEDSRADAVNSLVYEANARIRDPVYGCAGAICQLQSQINELQAELAKAQAEISNLQSQNADLVFIRMEISKHHQEHTTPQQQPYDNNTSFFLDEANLGVAWEPLWA